MEPISLGIGVAGLAGLFSACVDCFDLVQRGRYLGREYLLLETKYTNQRLRLLAWGRACGFLDKNERDAKIKDDHVRQFIQDNLVHIFNLLSNGKQLMKRYGLKEERQTSQALSMASSALETLILWKGEPSTAIGRRLQDLRDRAKSTQKQAKLAGSARWAISDAQKFEKLVQHLKDLIDDLESVTTSLGISSVYKELVRYEVESISDIQTLESMEEARLGTDDEISDAASHRLWLLRDRYDRPDQALLTADPTTRPKENDWEEVATSNAQLPSSPQEAMFQILHRVTCPLQPSTMFFDQPSYRILDHAEDQWVYLDRRKTSPSTSLHLGGARPVTNLEAYLAQNSAVQFVLFKDYACCHDSHQRQSADLQPNQHSIYLASTKLSSALDFCFNRLKLPRSSSIKRNTDIAPSLHVGLELGPPWAWFYHSKPYLIEQVSSLLQGDYSYSPWELPKLDEQEVKSALVLLETVKDISSKTFARFHDLRREHKVTWLYLPFIFSPGVPMVANQNKHQDYNQLYRLDSFPKLHGSTAGTEYLEFIVQYYQYMTSLSRPTSLTFKIHRTQFGAKGDAVLPITDLVIHPLEFSTSIHYHDILVRARTFWDVGPGQGKHFKRLSESDLVETADIGNKMLAWSKEPAHVVGYMGFIAGDTEYIAGRKFVIDLVNYPRLGDHQHSGRWLPNLQRKAKIEKTEEESSFQTYISKNERSYEDESDHDHDYEDYDDYEYDYDTFFDNSPAVDVYGDPTLLLPSTIVGFDMEDHRWKELRVENLRHIQWRTYSIDDLVMDETKKEVLMSFFNKATVSRLALLFHGNPGTGKSFAVGAIAEYAKKPIYKLNLADIGMTTSDIETQLSKAITLSNTWGCILLIEEIGSIFRKQMAGDFERDSKLSAFVRLIDELQGVVILTAREPPSELDEALKSRIHHIVPFGLNRTDHDQRTKMWKRQLKSMLSYDDYSSLFENLSNIEKLGTIDVQGWEIHNAISTAQQIAASQDKPVDLATLLLAVENLTGRRPLQPHGEA